jgi:hypothetical protein
VRVTEFAMAIQFYCSGCGQAIEVDDEFANRPIACPFCHATVEAPATSQLDRPAPATAAPLPTAAFPGAAPAAPGLYGPGPGAAPGRSNPAWLCTVGMLCGLGVPLVMVIWLLLVFNQPEVRNQIQALESQRADVQAQSAALAEQAKKWTEEYPGASLMISLTLVALVIGGLATSLAGLIRARTRRWQAVIGLLICGCCATAFLWTLAQARMKGMA